MASTPRALVVALVVSSVSVAPRASAAEPSRPERPMPWDALGANTVDAITGKSLLVFGGAILSTGAIAASGADDRVHSYFLEHDWTGELHRGFFIAGNFVPLVVPAAVWAGGLIADDYPLAGAGAGALQALGVSVVLVHGLKLATGRPLPTKEDEDRDEGFLKRSDRGTDFLQWGGVAWPSGHTSAMFSVVAAAHAYYPDHPWVAIVGYPLAAAMGWQMVEGHYHWLSDTVAGALIGWTIGDSIGRAFRVRYRDPKPVAKEPARSQATFQLAPMLGGTLGASVVGAF